MTIQQPPRLLKGFLIFSGYGTNINDSTNPLNGKAETWKYDVTITASSTSYPGPRNDYQYNGLDVEIGDWISSSIGGKALQIISIESQAFDKISVTVQDIGNYNALGDTTGNGDGSLLPGNCYVYQTTTGEMPVLTPEISGLFGATFGVDLISRFQYTKKDDNNGGGGGTTSLAINNIEIDWSTSAAVSTGQNLLFSIPSGVDFFVYQLVASDPMTLECHQTSYYNDTNPFKFIATSDQLIDDGSYVTNNVKYYGPRYAYCQNTENRTSGISYWKLTYNGSLSKQLSVTFNLTTYDATLPATTSVVYNNG